MSSKQQQPSKTRKSERRTERQEQQQTEAASSSSSGPGGSEQMTAAAMEHDVEDVEEEEQQQHQAVEEEAHEQQEEQQRSSSVVTTVTQKVTSLLTGTPIAAATAGSSAASSSSAGPSSSSGSSRRRSRSPLGISREQEKEELAHLNSRLACYIEFVRSQQQSADTVRRQYESLSESTSQEFSQSTGLYEREIGGLRLQVDRLAGERADLQLKLDRAAADRAQLERRAAALEQVLQEQQAQLGRADEAEAEVRSQRAEAERLCGQLAAAEKEAAAAAKELAALRKANAAAERNERENQRLQAELKDYEAQLRAFRDQLETEVKLKTELENRLQTATEEAAFKDSLFREERSRFQERSVVVEEVTKVREAEFESRLCEELRRAREEADQSAAAFRLNLETTFRTKMDELRTSSDRYSQDARSSREELVELRRSLHDSGLELVKARQETELLRASNARLEAALRQERQAFEEQLEHLRGEERRNRERLADQLEEYNNLLTSKLALDQEILAYRQLLEEEQRRTNYSPHPGHGRHKRRRVDVEGGESEEEEEARQFTVSQEQQGNLQVVEADPAGRFVRLRNTGGSDQQAVGVGGWTVRCEADDDGRRRVEYRFPAKTAVPPQAVVTVWSSDAGQEAKPPTDFVSKQASFGQATVVRASLVDSHGQEVAWRRMSIVEHRQRHIRGRRRLNDAAKVDRSCSIM